jgi:hypothetical protein
MRQFSGTHTVRVPAPVERARWYFTPEGERAWAGEHWDPSYPAGPPAGDGSALGTVFVVHGTVWTVVESAPLRLRYARVTPDVWAGTVTVALSGATLAEVAYDLTALSDDGAHRLEHFAAGFEHEMSAWEPAIAAAL